MLNRESRVIPHVSNFTFGHAHIITVTRDFEMQSPNPLRAGNSRLQGIRGARPGKEIEYSYVSSYLCMLFISLKISFCF